MKNNKHYIKWGITAFLVILGSFFSYYVIFHIDNFKSILDKLFLILMPIIDGLVLAYLLTPLVNATEKRLLKPCFATLKFQVKKSHRRVLAIVITISVVFLGIYCFFALVIPQIVNSIKTIVEQFPTYVDTLILWISKVLEDNPDIEKIVTDIINESSIDIEKFINDTAIPKLNNIIMTISLSIFSIFKELWNLIIGFIISIYILASKEVFAAQAKKICYAFFSIEASNRFITNVRFANKTFGGFFVGKILDSIIIGLICFIGTTLLNLPFTVLISVIIGVTNIIPFFGPFLGAIPSTLLILFINPIQALYFLVFVLLLQQVDGNIIGPKILGSSTGLSSFWVIFAITLFGGMFNIFGMIIGVPVLAVIFAFFKSLVESKLEDKELPVETAQYFKLLYIDTESSEIVDFSEDAKKPFGALSKILIKRKSILKNSNSNNKSEEIAEVHNDNQTEDNN